MGVLYAVAYTVKMSKLGDRRIDSFDDTCKDLFRWISVLRLPDFVTRADFSWACEAAAQKKRLDCSAADF